MNVRKSRLLHIRAQNNRFIPFCSNNGQYDERCRWSNSWCRSYYCNKSATEQAKWDRWKTGWCWWKAAFTNLLPYRLHWNRLGTSLWRASDPGAQLSLWSGLHIIHSPLVSRICHPTSRTSVANYRDRCWSKKWTKNGLVCEQSNYKPCCKS